MKPRLFSETMPILGRRLLRPFRVHHVTPDDFLRRGFLTVNGDVALISIPAGLERANQLRHRLPTHNTQPNSCLCGEVVLVDTQQVD